MLKYLHNKPEIYTLSKVMRLLYFSVALTFCLYAHASYAQVVSFKYLIEQTPVVKMPVYRYSPGEIVKIHMSFAKAETDSNLRKNISSIRNSIIDRIDLVYTKYKLNDSFDQKKLNTQRLKKLYSIMPEIFDNSTVEWNIIEQTDCPDEGTSKLLYHGFIFYITAPSAIVSKYYITDSIKSILGATSEMDFIEKSISRGTEKVDAKYIPFHKKVVKRKINDTTYSGKFYPNSHILYKAGVMFKKTGNTEREAEYDIKTRYVKDTIIERNSYHIGKFNYALAGLRDSSLALILDRNKNWSNAVVVEDVTGSMYTFTTQMFVWRRMQVDRGKINKFVFFNDGDDHPDGPAGKTGGIYWIESDSISKVEKMAFLAMQKGSGGQVPEGDIEAILKAQELYKTVTDIILIADNFARVRDLQLLPLVKKPVHVIVCGVINRKVLFDYIVIAHATNGSIHTAENDYNKLGDALSKGVVEIGKLNYMTVKGKIILVRK
ncbi:MAG: hypothetical protein SGJ10_04615 [Bacteroidota bacterium]|nr:hypothetical protein [Bacteroidota bacterium]